MVTDHEMRMEALRLFEENERLRELLERCRTVLGNMAIENEGAVFNRWPINHEPLRNDARNLLPLIDAALALSSSPAGTGDMEKVKRALERSECYIRAAAWKETSEPPYEQGQAHKDLAILHAALSTLSSAKAKLATR